MPQTEPQPAIKRKRRTKSRFVKFMERSNDPAVQQLQQAIEDHKNNLISNNKQKYWVSMASALDVDADEFKSVWVKFQQDAKQPKTNGSPYNLHMKEVIPTLRKKHPEMNHRDIFKMAAQSWTGKAK